MTTALLLSSAFANSLTCGQRPNCQNEHLHTTGAAIVPFTGLELAAIAAVAALLLAAALTLHRINRHRQ